MKIKSVKLPDIRNPFTDIADIEDEFWGAVLQYYDDDEDVPDGYGFMAHEVNHKPYESVEFLEIGRSKSSKSVKIVLPENVWKPRILLWVKAAATMYNFVDN